MEKTNKNTAYYDEITAKIDISMLRAIETILVLWNELKTAEKAGNPPSILQDQTITKLLRDLAVVTEELHTMVFDLTYEDPFQGEETAPEAGKESKIKEIMGHKSAWTWI